MKKKLNKKEFCDEIINRGLAPSKYEGDFPEHLKDILNRYLELLDELDEDERPEGFWATWEEIKNKIKNINDTINESVKAYYDGHHSKAFKCLVKDIRKEDFSYSFGSSKDYYRMRGSKDNKKLDYKGLFHIPFDMRTKVSTQRFSAPGYPCLYLGTSAYVCWEETQKPDSCYVSRFHVKSIFVYDLSLPSISYIKEHAAKLEKDEMKFHEQHFYKILLRLPLVLACMVRVAKPDDPFKPEYIIPQLFMEWVIDNDKIDNKEISGIACSSVRESDVFAFDSEKSINLVLPAFPPFKGKYSEGLCNLFQLTEPAYCKLEKERSNDEIREIFEQLEERLKDEKKFPLKKIDG